MPQGNAVRAIWARAKNDAWLVGAGGLAMHWDGRSWTTTPTGTSYGLYGVIGFAPDEVFAVGGDGHQGDALRWNGSAWTAMPRPGLDAWWRVIFGTSPDDLWIFGSTGNAAKAAHWTGASWSIHALPSGARAFGAWGTSANDFRTVGDFGGGAPAINRFDGTFSSGAVPSAQQLWSAWGSSNDDWWTSHYGGASHWNGSAWKTYPLDEASTLWTSLWGSSSSDVWAAGFEGGIAHWDGQQFEPDPATDGRRLLAVGGSAADDVWAGGLGGMLLHRAGPASPWTPIFDAETPWFNDVSGTSPNDLWAVGTARTIGDGPPVIAHGDGNAWSLVPLPASIASDRKAVLNGVWPVAPNDVWAVGSRQQESFALRWDGSTWTDAGDVPLIHANDVWAADATHVFAVGDGPSFGQSKIARWNGSGWSVASCGGSTLFAIHGASANDVWAVGDNGFSCHFDGTTWTPKNAPTTSLLYSVWTVGPNEAWAGTSHGQILRWNGTQWSVAHTVANGYSYNVRGIYADGKGTVVATAAIPYELEFGGFGPARVLRLASGAWTEEEPGTTNFLASLWGSGSRTWAVGAFGTVLRHD